MFSIFTKEKPTKATNAKPKPENPHSRIPSDWVPPKMEFIPAKDPQATTEAILSNPALADAQTKINAYADDKREAMLRFAIELHDREATADDATEFCRRWGVSPSEIDTLVTAYRERQRTTDLASQLDDLTEQYDDHRSLMEAHTETVKDLERQIETARKLATVARGKMRITAGRMSDARQAHTALRAKPEFTQFDDVYPELVE